MRLMSEMADALCPPDTSPTETAAVARALRLSGNLCLAFSMLCAVFAALAIVSPETAPSDSIWDAPSTTIVPGVMFYCGLALGGVIVERLCTSVHEELTGRLRSQVRIVHVHPERLVYVIGPVTGIPEDNRPAFEAARAAIDALPGCTASIPHGVVPQGAEWTPAMALSLARLVECDVVVWLPGTDASPGASLERAFCKETGKPCMPLARFLMMHGREGGDVDERTA